MFFRSYYKYLIPILIITLFPILAAKTSIWDDHQRTFFYLTKDFDFLQGGLNQGWYTRHFFYLIAVKFYDTFSIHPRILFGLLGTISVAGLSREIYFYLRNRFLLTERASFFGALIVLTFPLWHNLMASCLVVNAFLFWIFMIAVNSWPNKPIIATILLAFSLNLYSLFSLAVGILAVDFVLTVTKDTFWNKLIKNIIYSLILLISYKGLTSYIDALYGPKTYNIIQISNVLTASIYAIAAFIIICGGWYIWKHLSKQDIHIDYTLKSLLALGLLTFFSVFSYIAVGREVKYLNFGSFGTRHALLTILPIAIAFAFCAEALMKRYSKKILRGVGVFILTAFIVLLYQGYDHKVAALLFKEMLVYSMEQTPPPPSGYVSIEEGDYKAPRHVHSLAINLAFYEAYGRASWMANGFWSRRGHKYSHQDLKEIYADKSKLKLQGAFDVTGNDFTQYKFQLDNYHQEGRFWYWWYYITSDYSAFAPRLVRINT